MGDIMQDVSVIRDILTCHVGSCRLALSVGIGPEADDLILPALQVVSLTAVSGCIHTRN